MLAKTKYIILAASLAVLAGCAAPTTKMDPAASSIHLRLDSQFNADNCQWLGEITGSEGHWYSYLFFPNDVMVRGALNEAKNQALALGANTVYLVQTQELVTSSTVMGNAYHCPKQEK